MAADPLTRVSAETYYQNWGSDARPVLLGCSDGRLYVVKGRHKGRVPINDHIVGRLGGLISAPVTEIALVDVPQELISLEPNMKHMTAGVSHGSLWIPDCTDRMGFDYAGLPENRQRFPLLAILYSWAGVWSDHQFIYKKAPPHIVYSVDHGHFFPQGPNWSLPALANAPTAVVDPVFNACGFSQAELFEAARKLESVNQGEIAGIVAGVPDDWGISNDETTGMTEYLSRRRKELLSAMGISS